MDFKRAGLIAHKRGALNEAERCFDAAVCADVRDWQSIAALGSIAYDNGKLGQAYQLFMAAARVDRNASVLSDIGRVFITWGEYEAGLQFFEQAHELDPKNVTAMNNAAMACTNLGRVDDAAMWLTRARENLDLSEQLQANYSQVDQNWAFVHLMRQNWKEGWEAFDLGVGHGDREEREYGSMLPRWSPFMGPNETVVVYGEQGIGDEILFASCIPDLMAKAENVIIETMPRLVGVFSRSFPGARVYGTRYDKHPRWLSWEKPTSKTSVGQLPRWFRNSNEDFPGTPYVTPNPDMKFMVRGLLSQLPRKPKIGVAWSGGTVVTQWQERRLDIAELMKAFKGIDAEFISLQHTIEDGETPEDHGVRVFPMITHRELDYEWTMALLSELDLVVSVPTAVVHAAGAIGTPTLVLLNDHAQWRCGGPTMPWWNSVEVLREWTLKGVAKRVREVVDG